MLDDSAPFQRTVLTRSRMLADAMHPVPRRFDPDPELTELEQRGKAVFNRSCAQCHGVRYLSGLTLDAAIWAADSSLHHNIQMRARVRAPTGSNPAHRDSRVTHASIASRWPMARISL
jgi:mono/diheme cytochrome c family protein